MTSIWSFLIFHILIIIMGNISILNLGIYFVTAIWTIYHTNHSVNGKCFRQNGHRQKIKKYINPMQVIITPAIDNSGTTISVKSVVVKSNSPTTINVLPIIFLFFIFLNHPLINMCRKFRANRIN